MKYDIFISYRREGGYETAKHLFDLLTRDGYSVSFDIDTLRNGDFDATLLQRIEECTDFILILDAHVFDRTLDPNFPKEKDWLYQELSYALKQNKNIIPIMLSGFGFPDDLPDDIVKVQRKNGPKYDKYYFDEFYKKLKREFFDTPVPKINAIKEQNASGVFTLLISVDETSILFINDKKIRKIRQGTTANINTLKYGFKYKITLKSQANNKEEYIVEYEVPDKRESDEIKIEFKKMRDERKKIELEKRIENKRIKEQQDIIKQKLRLICDENYDWHDQIYHNTVRVNRNGKYGFLDIRGFAITSCDYNDARNFEGNYAYVCKGTKWGIINQSGDLIIECTCDLPSWIINGFTVLLQNKKQALVNLQQPGIILGTFDDVILTELSNRFIVKNKDNYYLIDENGNNVGEEKFNGYHEYDSDWSHSNDTRSKKFPMIVFRKNANNYRLHLPNNMGNNKYQLGLIDENGVLIIPCKMQSIIPILVGFSFSRYYIIKTESKFGVFDIESMSYSIPPIYKEFKGIRRHYLISERIICYARNNYDKWGAININNEEIVPFKYDDCQKTDFNLIYDLKNKNDIIESDISYSYAFYSFIKLLSKDRFTSELKNEWFTYTVEQYRNCIISSGNEISELVYYPFKIKATFDYSSDNLLSDGDLISVKTFYYSLLGPTNESFSAHFNKVKDIYYKAFWELYGEKEAKALIERLSQCQEKKEYDSTITSKKLSLDDILKKAKTGNKNEVLTPEISIICAESSDYAYRTLTEEINRIKETFKQNGFSSKSKDVHIVLLTDSIFRDNKTIDEVNRVITSPKNAIFIGSSLSLNKNDTHQLKQWIENQTYYSYLLNIIRDKETIALKLFALLNGWEGADSDGTWLWQSDDDEQV